MMARAGIVFGLLLCAMTVGSLLATTEKSISQFLPMMLGIPFLFLGVVSLNPHRRPAAILAAGGLAALGTVMGAGRLLLVAIFQVRGQQVNALSVRTLFAMTLVCSVFCLGVLYWHSRRQKRRRRAAPDSESTVELSDESRRKLRSAQPSNELSNPYQSPAINDSDPVAVRTNNPSNSSSTMKPHD